MGKSSTFNGDFNLDLAFRSSIRNPTGNLVQVTCLRSAIKTLEHVN